MPDIHCRGPAIQWLAELALDLLFSSSEDLAIFMHLVLVKFIIFQGRDQMILLTKLERRRTVRVHSEIHQGAEGGERLEGCDVTSVVSGWDMKVWGGWRVLQENIKYIRIKLVILRNGIVDRKTKTGRQEENNVRRSFWDLTICLIPLIFGKPNFIREIRCDLIW